MISQVIDIIFVQVIKHKTAINFLRHIKKYNVGKDNIIIIQKLHHALQRMLKSW